MTHIPLEKKLLIPSAAGSVATDGTHHGPSPGTVCSETELPLPRLVPSPGHPICNDWNCIVEGFGPLRHLCKSLEFQNSLQDWA